MDVQSGLRAEIVSSVGALDALEPAWWELWWRCPPATPFQSPAWLIPWWHAFAPGELATVAIWQGAALVGLAPFYLERGEAGTRLLPLGVSLSDYLDVLIDPACEPQAADAIVNAVLALDWEIWELQELRPQAQAWSLLAAPVLAGAHSLPGRSSLSPATPMCIQRAPLSACPVVLLSGPPDLSGCVPPRRRQLLRTARSAATRRGHDIAEMRPDETQAFLGELFRLHAMRWYARGEEGVLADTLVQRFHRAALPRLAAAGLAHCFLIRIAGQVAGAYHGFHHRTAAYYYLGGFDPAFAKESPGAILIGHAMSEALREAAGEFHFLRGREAYKYGWGAVDRWNERCGIARAPQ